MWLEALEMLLDKLEQNMWLSAHLREPAATWQYLLEDGKPDLLYPTCSNFVSLSILIT
jgi:hypothetical protein